MGILLCEQNFRDVWIRNKSVRAEIGQILHTDTSTHTHTTAAKLVVRIPPSHRRRGATTVFGQNRHHRSDTASSFSKFVTHFLLRGAAEPQRCHCGHGDPMGLQLPFDGGATAIIGGMTVVFAAALRGQ